MLIFVQNSENFLLFSSVRRGCVAGKTSSGREHPDARETVQKVAPHFENLIFCSPAQAHNAAIRIGILTKGGFLGIRYFSGFIV